MVLKMMFVVSFPNACENKRDELYRGLAIAGLLALPTSYWADALKPSCYWADVVDQKLCEIDYSSYC